jgi:hypothetical protein
LPSTLRAWTPFSSTLIADQCQCAGASNSDGMGRQQAETSAYKSTHVQSSPAAENVSQHGDQTACD